MLNTIRKCENALNMCGYLDRTLIKIDAPKNNEYIFVLRHDNHTIPVWPRFAVLLFLITLEQKITSSTCELFKKKINFLEH